MFFKNVVIRKKENKRRVVDDFYQTTCEQLLELIMLKLS
jgi:hypothetical protein